MGRTLPVFRRDVEAGLVHEGEQPDGLHRDGLAAGVRARDDEDGRLRSDAHGYRYGVVPEEGVSRVHELDYER